MKPKRADLVWRGWLDNSEFVRKSKTGHQPKIKTLIGGWGHDEKVPRRIHNLQPNHGFCNPTMDSMTWHWSLITDPLYTCTLKPKPIWVAFFFTNNKALDSTASYLELFCVVFALLHALNMFIKFPCRLEKLIITHLKKHIYNKIKISSCSQCWGQSHTSSHHAAVLLPPNMS